MGKIFLKVIPKVETQKEKNKTLDLMRENWFTTNFNWKTKCQEWKRITIIYDKRLIFLAQ